jgi:putative peptidoglycan lipid II flippase
VGVSGRRMSYSESPSSFQTSRPAQVATLAASLALFAPGLVGYGLVAALSRVLLAAHRTRAAAIPVAAGWLIVVAADVVLVALAPARWVVAMLALGNTIGLTIAGLALVVAVRRTRGPAALAGTGRAAASGLAAAIAGAIGGTGVAAALPLTHPATAALVALLAVGCGLAAFVVVAYVLDGGDLRAAVTRIRQAMPR